MLQVHPIAQIGMEAPVYKVEWDSLWRNLAVAVHKPDLVSAVLVYGNDCNGDWTCHHRIIGHPNGP